MLVRFFFIIGGVENDYWQFGCLKLACQKEKIYSFILPAKRVTKVANATTETDEIGIKMAATTGDKFPVIAKLIPMML